MIILQIPIDSYIIVSEFIILFSGVTDFEHLIQAT
jgi:hypothetical protein